QVTAVVVDPGASEQPVPALPDPALEFLLHRRALIRAQDRLRDVLVAFDPGVGPAVVEVEPCDAPFRCAVGLLVPDPVAPELGRRFVVEIDRDLIEPVFIPVEPLPVDTERLRGPAQLLPLVGGDLDLEVQVPPPHVRLPDACRTPTRPVPARAPPELRPRLVGEKARDLIQPVFIPVDPPPVDTERLRGPAQLLPLVGGDLDLEVQVPPLHVRLPDACRTPTRRVPARRSRGKAGARSIVLIGPSTASSWRAPHVDHRRGPPAGLLRGGPNPRSRTPAPPGNTGAR